MYAICCAGKLCEDIIGRDLSVEGVNFVALHMLCVAD